MADQKKRAPKEQVGPGDNPVVTTPKGRGKSKEDREKEERAKNQRDNDTRKRRLNGGGRAGGDPRAGGRRPGGVLGNVMAMRQGRGGGGGGGGGGGPLVNPATGQPFFTDEIMQGLLNPNANRQPMQRSPLGQLAYDFANGYISEEEFRAGMGDTGLPSLPAGGAPSGGYRPPGGTGMGQPGGAPVNSYPGQEASAAVRQGGPSPAPAAAPGPVQRLPTATGRAGYPNESAGGMRPPAYAPPGGGPMGSADITGGLPRQGQTGRAAPWPGNLPGPGSTVGAPRPPMPRQITAQPVPSDLPTNRRLSATPYPSNPSTYPSRVERWPSTPRPPDYRPMVGQQIMPYGGRRY